MTIPSIEGATIAITGGTGSFCSTMTRNLLARGASRISGGAGYRPARAVPGQAAGLAAAVIPPAVRV